MTMKDRVKELRRVPASELRANPKNWRRHPPSQEAALRGVLEDMGASILRRQSLAVIQSHDLVTPPNYPRTPDQVSDVDDTQ